jgi:hypothetical protein
MPPTSTLGDATRVPACKIVGDHVALMVVGHFSVTKYVQTTQKDHRRQAFAVAKRAGNQSYPRNNHNYRPRILGFWVRPHALRYDSVKQHGSADTRPRPANKPPHAGKPHWSQHRCVAMRQHRRQKRQQELRERFVLSPLPHL